MRIKSLRAFKILNSRAQPTIAIQFNKSSWAGAPQGASEGKKEIPSYPRGVDTAITSFNRISKNLIGLSIDKFSDLEKVEDKLNLEVLGGATIIALEFAILKELAINKEIYQFIGKPKMPLPLGNVIGGGAHAGYGDLQECLLSPQTKTFTDAAFINAEIHKNLKYKLQKLDSTFTGGKTDEGAWTTRLSDLEILDLVNKARKQAEKDYKVRILFGVDFAASRLFSKEKYVLNNYSPKKRSLILSKEKYFGLIQELAKHFDLNYLEDPFPEDDVAGFAQLLKGEPRRMICADDLVCTNPILLDKIIYHKAANAVIVKPNQIGSLVLTKKFVDMARKAGLKTVVSHRSGDLPDPVLSHLALCWGDYFKCGIAGGERVAKINELIRIENL